MNYSPPSVCRGVGLLKKGGYLETRKDGLLVLTEEGKHRAEKTLIRHKTLTDFFVRLGIPEEIASADACKIEHVISDMTFDALKAHVDSKK